MSFDTTQTTSLQNTRRKRISLIGSILVIVLAIISALCTEDCQWIILRFKEDLASNWTDIFTKYFFIIVALERAVAVWVGVTRGVDNKAWKKRVDRLRGLFNRTNENPLTLVELRRVYSREKKIIDDIQNKDSSNSFLGNPDPYVVNESDSLSEEKERDMLIAYLRVTLQIYEFKLSKFEEQSSALTTKLVFFGGLILAIVGISIVGDIIDASDLEACDGCFQFYLYRGVDIVITGGLMGGGSRGFSLFINTLKQVFQKVKDSNQ